MGVVRTGDSEYDKEIAKWDTPRRQGGYRPDGYEQFPMMLSKAQKKPNGQYSVHEQPPLRYLYPAGSMGDAEWSMAVLRAEEFTKSCQMTVRSQQEMDRAVSNGWVVGQEEALAAAQKWETAIADAAAERLYRDQHMGEKARAEAAAIDASTSEHIADIPAPKRRPGRPAKSVDLVSPA